MRRVEPIFQALKRKRDSGETSKEVVQSAISPERQRITPSTSVAPLTCLVTIKPTTSIAEVFKPTQLHPLTFFGPVNQLRPKTRTLPLKPTTVIAEKLTAIGQKPTPVAAVLIEAAVPEREETNEEKLLKKFHEIMKAKSVRKPSSGGLPKSSRPPKSLGKSQSSVGPHRPTPSESLQQRTREWVEGTLKKQ